MKILKRDCTSVEFDASKIYNAIMSAMRHGSGIVKPDIAVEISQEIGAELESKKKNRRGIQRV